MINYLDLLGRPWQQLNCGEVVKECLFRMGKKAAADAMPLTAEAAHEEYDSRWVIVGSQREKMEEGAVIVSDNKGELQASVTVGLGMAVTSSRQFGVQALPIRRIRNTIGCYRWEE